MNNKILNNKKKLNIIKNTIIIVSIIGLVICSVVSQDSHHLEICKDHDCSICAVIHIAQAIIQITSLICILIIELLLIHYILSKIHKNKNIIVINSLVFQNIQLNE